MFYSLFVVRAYPKKEILYLQDAEQNANKDIVYSNTKIQFNDVLQITDSVINTKISNTIL